MKNDVLRDCLFLLGFGLVFCVYQIGAGSLASWDESIYAQVAKEMFQSGEYVHLTLGGDPWYHKPPLYFWITSFFYQVMGIQEFSARLLSALSGVATVLATYFVGRILFNRLAALIGAGALLSSTDFLHYSRWGVLDITNLFFLTLVVACFLKGRENERWYIGFWFAAALAFMIKGPVVALILGVLFLFALLTRNFKLLQKRTFWAGLGLALIVVLPWHIAVYRYSPQNFMHDYIGGHWLSRSFQAIEGHTGNFYFYIRTLINKYHPWVAFLPFSLSYVSWLAVRTKKNGYILLLIWIFFILGVFTFVIQTKLAWYILPAYPALSLSVGVLLAMKLKDRHSIWVKLVIVTVLVLHIPYSSVMIQDYAPGIKSVAPLVRKAVPGDEPLFLYRYHEQPAVTFYTDKNKVMYLDTVEALDAMMTRRPALWILVPGDVHSENAEAFAQRGFRPIYTSRGLKRDLVFISNRLVD